MSRATVVIELESDAQSRELAAGRVFVPGCGLPLGDECDLMVCGANHQVLLAARAVYVDQHGGAGLELIGLSDEVKAQLAELEPIPSTPVVLDEPAIEDASLDGLGDRKPEDFTPASVQEPAALIDLESLYANDDDLTIPVASYDPDDDEPDAQGGATDAYERVAGSEEPGDDQGADVYTGDDTLGAEDTGHHDAWDDGAREPAGGEGADTLDPEPSYGGDEAEGDLERSGERRFARNVHERLRGLNLAAQIKMAVSGELHERIVLERLYGKNVWETLLRNPRLTAPEVSRIARYGSLPRVLLEVIVGNNAWLQVPEVRRALLSNPRLATDQIMKVLRLTPKHELKLAAIQTAYPQAVRNAAKMILRGG